MYTFVTKSRLEEGTKIKLCESKTKAWKSDPYSSGIMFTFITETNSLLPPFSSNSLHQLVLARFEKQPPDNMRKSNFFNFVISLYDGNNQPVEVHQASFKDFCDTHSVSHMYT